MENLPYFFPLIFEVLILLILLIPFWSKSNQLGRDKYYRKLGWGLLALLIYNIISFLNLIDFFPSVSLLEPLGMIVFLTGTYFILATFCLYFNKLNYKIIKNIFVIAGILSFVAWYYKPGTGLPGLPIYLIGGFSFFYLGLETTKKDEYIIGGSFFCWSLICFVSPLIAGSRLMYCLYSIAYITVPLGILTENLVGRNKDDLLYPPYDSITGFPGKIMLKNKFSRFINNSNKDINIIVIDIDRLRDINNAFGYDFGNKLLKKVSTRLKNLLAGRTFITRLASDRFCILWKKSGQVETILKEIIGSTQKPFMVEEQKLYISFTMGISTYPDDGKTINELIKKSDIALSNAARGDKYYCFYSSELSLSSADNLKLSYELKNAVEEEKLEVFYQPIFGVQTGNMVAVEALVRWNHEQKGYIPPNRFIPIAEKSGIILELDEYVIKKACREIKILHNNGYKDVVVSVNFSALHFKKRDFAGVIYEALDNGNLKPELLEIEITERNMIENIGDTRGVFAKLRENGVKIALDDFGVGYSSLNYLKDFKIDELKIDRSFISNLNNPHNKIILNSIINMAQELNFTIVAEGVETREQYNYLKEKECDCIQGYLFGKPVPIYQLLDCLQKGLFDLSG